MNINLTLFGQMIFFGIFVWFCMKYVWPPILNALNEREKKIADGLAFADTAKQDLRLAKEKAAAELKESRQKAAEIIDLANKRANQIIDEAKETALVEAERTKTMKLKEVEQAAYEAKESLRKQVASLAVAGASKILETSVDQKAHDSMLQKLASEL